MPSCATKKIIMSNFQNKRTILIIASGIDLTDVTQFCPKACILPHPNPLPQGEGTPFPLRGKGWG